MVVGEEKTAEPLGAHQRSAAFQVHQGPHAKKHPHGREFLVGNEIPNRWVTSKLRKQRIQGFRAGIETPPFSQQGRKLGGESEFFHLAHRYF